MTLTTVPTTTAITTCSYTRGDQFDMLTVNDTKFAIFNKPLCSDESQNITLAANCQCVFLAPMEAEQDIVINATNILAFGSFSAKTTHIHAKNFYGMGIEVKGELFVQTDEDIIISGDLDKTRVEGRNIVIGLSEEVKQIATEVKRLFSQGIDDNGLQIGQALLMASEIPSKPTQPLLLTNG